MPETRAVAKYIRMSPTKVRHVIDAVRGKAVPEALAILRFTPNRAAEAISKVVKSAAANASDRYDLDPEELTITRCFVDPGPTIKRIQPRAMGRAFRILKRTSHITVIVSNETGPTRR